MFYHLSSSLRSAALYFVKLGPLCMSCVQNVYVAISYLFVKLHVFCLAIYLGSLLRLSVKLVFPYII